MHAHPITALAAGLGLAFALAGAPAEAAFLSFGCITANDASGAACAAGEAQLSAEVLDAGPAGAFNRANFVFRNTGALPGSITAVYFDDGTLLGIAALQNGTGVRFSQGGTPPNLPGANQASPPFQVTAGFLADSDPPTQPNGVNPGEQLGILFNLQSGRLFNDVLADLGTGALRIGLHVQALPGGGSESFVNVPLSGSGEPPSAVPLPAAAWLLLGGLGLLGAAGRRRAG